MTEDLAAGGASAPRPDVAAQLRELTAPRRLAVDEPVFAAPGLPGTFRLQLFTAPGARPVAVATQAAGEGMSLMNGVERYAGAVWERHCPGEVLPPVWVERQLPPEGERHEARFRLVVFADADGYRPSGPRWRALTHEQLQDLVGAPVAADRGPGHVPRPAEQEPRLVFEEYAVARLARPAPFREPGCMPAGMVWWRRLLRQARPRRTAGSCCWYHGGDWHAVNTMALDVLARARAGAVDAEEMERFAVGHAAAAGATDWQVQALASLFNTANAIQPSTGPGYVNGQHRAQAMLEAGVRRTVILRPDYTQ